jgi:MFS family permease
MISGYSSKKLNWKKYKRTFTSLLATYILFQTLYSLPGIAEALGLKNVPSVMGGFSWINFLFVPVGPLWYIIGLLIWRLFACAIIKFKINFFWSLAISVTAALAMGFIDVLIPNSRIFTFFPFFVLGFFCPKSFFEKISSKYSRIISASILTVIAVLIGLFAGQEYFISLFGEVPYSAYSSIMGGFSHRALFYLLAVVGSVCVICLIPETFHRWGSKSLTIYLLHPLIVYPTYYGILYAFNLQMPVYVDLAVAAVIVAICIWFSKLKTTKYFVNPIMLIR